MTRLLVVIILGGILYIGLLSCGRTVVAARPAAPVYARPAAPGQRYVWVDGNWIARGGRYQWRDGYWAPARKKQYVPGHWAPKRNGWYWQRGHWR